MLWGLQSPDERLDWHHDWTDWMENNDEIYASEWEIDNPAGELTTAPLLEGPDFDGMITTVFVSGLMLGKSYQLKNIITTTAQRIGTREITIRCDRQT